MADEAPKAENVESEKQVTQKLEKVEEKPTEAKESGNKVKIIN